MVQVLRIPSRPSFPGTAILTGPSTFTGPLAFTGPAVALLELESIARGYVAADALVKKAAVRLLVTEAVTPGKFLLMFDGPEADVEEAFTEGVAVAGSTLIDRLHLPFASTQLATALGRNGFAETVGSVGIVETHTAASALLAADRAVKEAEVDLVYLRLARGIGGKAYFLVAGSLDMTEAALAAAAAGIAPELLLATEIIPSPHPELLARLRP